MHQASIDMRVSLPPPKDGRVALWEPELVVDGCCCCCVASSGHTLNDLFCAVRSAAYDFAAVSVDDHEIGNVRRKLMDTMRSIDGSGAVLTGRHCLDPIAWSTQLPMPMIEDEGDRWIPAIFANFSGPPTLARLVDVAFLVGVAKHRRAAAVKRRCPKPPGNQRWSTHPGVGRLLGAHYIGNVVLPFADSVAEATGCGPVLRFVEVLVEITDSRRRLDH